MKRVSLLLLSAVWLAHPSSSSASADFVVEAEGSQFSDPTPTRPTGGNRAATLGAQRLAAVKYAANLWGRLLDSPVPIVINVRYVDRPCEGSRLTLAGARAADHHILTATFASGESESIVAPVALVNRIAMEDTVPGRPDILVEINSAVDTGCEGLVKGWYLGLDGQAGDYEDLVDTLLHEFAHGLGFASLVRHDTGALPEIELESGETMRIADAFTSMIVEVQSGRPWFRLSDAERLRSANTPRGLVWGGARVAAAIADHLTRGAPKIAVEPPLPGFTGMIGDAGIGSLLRSSGVQGPLYFLSASAPCSAPPEVVGHVVVVTPSLCRSREHYLALERAGVAGVLLVHPQEFGAAPLSMTEPRDAAGIGIPVVTLASGDGELLRAAQVGIPRRVRLYAEANQYAGADAQGRPYLYTNQPAERGSNISHFETLARPDLLMEPAARARTTHDVDLTRALLADIGWTVTCGNGALDAGELCDEGAANSDAPGARCLKTCKPPSCGDRIVSAGEACDEGEFNSDTDPGGCSSTCQKVSCPSGLVERGGRCEAAPPPPPGVTSPTGSIAPWPEAEEADDFRDEGGCNVALSSPSRLTGLLSCLGLLALGRRRRQRAPRG